MKYISKHTVIFDNQITKHTLQDKWYRGLMAGDRLNNIPSKCIPITVWQQLDKRITIASAYDPKIDLKHIRNSGGKTYLVSVVNKNA